MTCKKLRWKRRKKIVKTLTWRAIATATTFSVALALTDDVEKSGAVAAIDTVLKTVFYYIHESCYEKAEKWKWKLCYNEETIEENLESQDVENTVQTSDV